jgi:hypothetical protein
MFESHSGEIKTYRGIFKKLTYDKGISRKKLLDAEIILAQNAHFGAPEQLLQRPPLPHL